MKTWPGIVAAILLPACGARSELPTPPVDFVEPGPPPAYCQDAGETAIYVVTEQSELFRFDPPSAVFTSVGTLQCPVTGTAEDPTPTPFSMAVSYQGTAYIVFDDGEMFTASGATASCTPTSSPVDSSAFTPTYGMGFSADLGGLGETLYLASTDTPGHIGSLDTSTFVIQDVGPFSSDIGEVELTGTGAGQLFGFGVVQGLDGSHLAQIDKANAVVLSDTIVPTPENPDGWAFAFWGGDFYFFTAEAGGSSTVGRFHPADGSFDAAYATLASQTIVGAGVSTCAPQ